MADKPLHDYIDLDAYDVVPRADYDRLREALDYLVDEAVERWHESCPHEERPLHEWLGLSWDQYAMFVQDGTLAGVPSPVTHKEA